MPQRILEFDKVVKTAEQVVLETGSEHIVDKCMYESEGKPMCLVGQILYRLGWSVEELNQLDHADDPQDFGDGLDYSRVPSATGINDLIEYNLVHVDGPLTKEFLYNIQAQQDAYSPWGQALKYAKSHTGLTQPA